MRCAAGLALLGLLSGAGSGVADRGAVSPPSGAALAGVGATGAAAAVPGSDLPVARARRYRMAGRVRPLLFWFGRDDVGMARVVWRRDEAGRKGYEFLVGTDPARAPRGLNRWGFIAERADEAGGAPLALMPRSHEAAYAEAAAGAGSGGNELRAIRSRVGEGMASVEVSTVRGSSPFTVHDLDTAVTLVRRDAERALPGLRLDPGTRPGFLVSVAELLDRAVADGPGSRGVMAPVRYVFGRRLYDLRAGPPDRVAAALGTNRTAAVRLPFEIRNLSTGARTRFEITAGSEGDLRAVPVLIRWQPRWWLEVELHLMP